MGSEMCIRDRPYPPSGMTVAWPSGDDIPLQDRSVELILDEIGLATFTVIVSKPRHPIASDTVTV